MTTGERPRVVLREEPRRGPGADVEVGGDLARQRLEVFRWKAQCQKALNRKNNQGGLERGGGGGVTCWIAGSCWVLTLTLT